MVDSGLFTRFEQGIRSFDPLDPKTLDSLLLDHNGRLSIYYAPFDYVNLEAELVLVGVTPGRTQMYGALEEARRQLQPAPTLEPASIVPKTPATFEGLR